MNNLDYHSYVIHVFQQDFIFPNRTARLAQLGPVRDGIELKAPCLLFLGLSKVWGFNALSL